MFSDDKQDEFAASVGLDYMFRSQRWRPTLGAAYLGDNSYIGLDLGYDFNSGSLDYGVSAGGLNTDDPNAPIAPVVPGGGVSDMRLKTDIAKVGELESGIALYQFRYKTVEGFDGVLNTETIFVGVMAQDLLETHPAAVVMGDDGFYRVDYSQLGFAMMTLAEWQATDTSSLSHRFVLANAA